MHQRSSPPLAAAKFAEAVREVLDHLYDSPYLQKHQLTERFVDRAVDPRVRSQELRRIFLDAIQAMRPTPRTPAQSADWRAYRILELRYLEGLTPRQTMEEVALAKSQFYREQARILDMLIDYLWVQYCNREPTQPVPTTTPAPALNFDPGPEQRADEKLARAQLVQAEVARLCAHAAWQAVDIGVVLAELQQVIRGVAAAQGVTIQIPAITGLNVPRADWVLLRQAILNVITYGLDHAGGGRLIVTPLRQQNIVGIRLRAQPATHSSSTVADAAHAPTKARQGIGLLISQQLMMAMGGELLIAPSPSAVEETDVAGLMNHQNDRPPTDATAVGVVTQQPKARAHEGWEARLIWSTDTAPVLLVIDDNEGLLRLFQRYLVGYEWQVIGVTDGAQTWRKLEQLRPTVIILDVMMPKEDGWAILQRLKADPTTATIPVLICSVLNEPHLAKSLGATAYLPKPVGQRALLQALARWWPAAANSPLAHPAAPSAVE